MKIIDYLDRKFYPNFQENWDDCLFRSIILERLNENMKMIDIGAGSGIIQQMCFKGMCRSVVGIDPDERVISNPHLDEARVAWGEKIPYDDNAFDMAVSNNVWEHITNPIPFLKEVHRVLKPQGTYFAKLPNVFHYVPLIAKITPHRFHEIVNKWRGRSHSDTFKTYYNLNSRHQIKEYARKVGFEIEYLESFEGRPEYLRLTTITYLIGIAYERIVNASSFLEGIRVIHVVGLKKT